MSSSWSFVVSGLTFKSLTNFDFIFAGGVRRWSSFILLSGSPRLPLPRGALLPPWSHTNRSSVLGLFLGSLVFHGCVCLLLLIPCCLGY